MLTVRDINESSIEDAFRVCSFDKLTDSLQKKGIELRRRWIGRMLKEIGPCVKVAYLDDRPVAHLMFYPEPAVPFIAQPRKGAVLLRCVYNPFPEARGIGAARALIGSLIEDCRGGAPFLRGEICSFIAADAFNTGEGVPMEKLYEGSGFSRRGDEMVLEVSGGYVEPKKNEYHALEEDRGRGIIFYNPTCEYSYPSATRVRSFLRSREPSLEVDLIDQWEQPVESLRRANRWLIVNARAIRSTWFERDSLTREVDDALHGGAV